MTNNSGQTGSSALQGMTLPTGWEVVAELCRNEDLTGGQFSHIYVVERNGKRGFLKAFDFSEAFDEEVDTFSILADLGAGYRHEFDILQLCIEKRMSRVVVALDGGAVMVPGYPGAMGKVFYIVFELADGDVSGQVDLTTKFDTLWSLQVLKDVSLGLEQLHAHSIAHQDIRPSNVLIFRGERVARIADLGRAHRKGRPVWFDERNIAGCVQYAPLELRYGHVTQDFATRHQACDLYMLGDLTAFMFTGAHITPSVIALLDPQFAPDTWQGTYQQVLAYVEDAFAEVLSNLAAEIDPLVRDEIISVIRQLCLPDLARRGHPNGIGRPDQFSTRRYVTLFDVLGKKTDLRQRILDRSA